MDPIGNMNAGKYIADTFAGSHHNPNSLGVWKHFFFVQKLSDFKNWSNISLNFVIFLETYVLKIELKKSDNCWSSEPKISFNFESVHVEDEKIGEHILFSCDMALRRLNDK